MSTCVGIDDIGGKVIGSSNPINVAVAFRKILERQKSPITMSKEAGLKIMELKTNLEHGRL
jgi:ribosomal protein S5